jgi:hypothetical protein
MRVPLSMLLRLCQKKSLPGAEVALLRTFLGSLALLTREMDHFL